VAARRAGASPGAPSDPPRWEHVRRELQRARGARRLVPWAFGSALLSGAFVSWAARSWEAGVPLLAGGLALGLVVGALARPHCPACGAVLWRRGERPGPPTAPVPVEVERTRQCPNCGVRFNS
jgi:predicted RNA-binding Zn-ribbon protein involved in translation (DUF1610 family)